MRKSMLLLAALLPLTARADVYVTVVEGLGGTPEYATEFDAERKQIVAASHSLTAQDNIASFAGDEARREPLLKHFDALAKRMKPDDRAVIYLIGHGSFDGVDYKFNLPGPDITGDDLKNVLAALPGTNNLLVNTSSTSGAMLDAINGKPEKGRDEKEASPNLLISATRNGVERNATHFGHFFAEALASVEADTNKNNSVSVQEAFDYATRGVEAFFKNDEKLATEHAQLRGDGAAAFTLARLGGPVVDSNDPLISKLEKQKQDINNQIEDLQLNRARYSNDDYLKRLQALILQAAQINAQIDAAQQASPETALPTVTPPDATPPPSNNPINGPARTGAADGN